MPRRRERPSARGTQPSLAFRSRTLGPTLGVSHRDLLLLSLQQKTADPSPSHEDISGACKTNPAQQSARCTPCLGESPLEAPCGRGDDRCTYRTHSKTLALTRESHRLRTCLFFELIPAGSSPLSPSLRRSRRELAPQADSTLLGVGCHIAPLWFREK